MTLATTIMGLLKGLDGDNARDYLKTSLAASLDVLDAHKHRGGTSGSMIDTLSASQASGDLFYASGANALTRLAKGVANQHLAMNGAATAPEWVTNTPGVIPPKELSAGAWSQPAANSAQYLNYQALTNWKAVPVWAFDTTTEESLEANFAIPSGITFTTCTLNVDSLQPAATSGTLGWKVTTISRASGEQIDTAGTLDTATAAAVPGTAKMMQRISKALTVTGWAAGERVFIKLARDVANDTVAEDAYFLGAELVFS